MPDRTSIARSDLALLLLLVSWRNGMSPLVVPVVANPNTIRFGRWRSGHCVTTASRHTSPRLRLAITWAAEGGWSCLKRTKRCLHLTANALTAEAMAALTADIAAACRKVAQAANSRSGHSTKG